MDLNDLRVLKTNPATTDLNDAYADGFITKCRDHDVDPEQVYNMATTLELELGPRD